jgi:hypothetical protein
MIAISAKSIKNRYDRICKGDCLYSNFLGEKRKFWVYLPPSFDGQNPGKQSYPVVYLLDAEEHFRNFTEMIQRVNQVDNSRLFQDMIVIGIPNTKRSRDLTPTHSVIDAKGKNEKDFKPSGGGEHFIAFLEKELIPHVEATYPTTSYRVLAGHSLGGLTAVNILLNYTYLFSGYIASDPSMWWDDKLMLNKAREVLKQQRFDGIALYVSIANVTPLDMKQEQLRTDATPKTNHIRCIFEFADLLTANPSNGLRSASKFYEKDTHNSVPAVTNLDGLRFLLDQ